MQSFFMRSLWILFVLLGLGGYALAQAATTTPPTTPVTPCVRLTTTLQIGSTNASTNGQVSQLQQFLNVSPTGYFGPLTQQALQNWQAANGVVASGNPGTTGFGVAGPLTRTALACRAQPVLPIAFPITTPIASDPLPIMAPVITSAVLTNPPVGGGPAELIVNGTNLDLVTSLNFSAVGATNPTGAPATDTLTTILSHSQNSVAFQPDTYLDIALVKSLTITVSNVAGTSNAFTFVPEFDYLTPVIQSVAPAAASIGGTVTLQGTGFASNNTVYLNNQALTQANSTDGQTLSFIVPNYYNANCSSSVCTNALSLVTSGTYNLSVGNSNGASNNVSFTINGNGTITTRPVVSIATPVIQSLSPSSGPAGTVVTVSGINLNNLPAEVPANSLMLFASTAGGQSISFPISSFSQTASSVTFTVPTSLAAGTYNVSFVSNGGQVSNAVTFTVTAQTSPSDPVARVTPVFELTIQSLSPSSGTVGSNVTVTGTGFTSTGNIVLLGSGVAATAPSTDGKTLSFTVPGSVGPNCTPGSMCPDWLELITSGIYPIAIQNINGISNNLPLMVTGGTASISKPIIATTTGIITPPGPINTRTIISPQGQVLGAFTYNFTQYLTLGSSGREVEALQQYLATDQVYTGPITSYFGVQTQAAVKLYQTNSGLPATGNVGPLTREKLNIGSIPTSDSSTSSDANGSIQ